MRVPDQIFRSYDIRGFYPEEVNPELAYAIANQFVDLVGAPKRVLVVHDARVSAAALQDAVIRGISDAGATALLAGLGPTDLFYYGCASLVTPGIMITASHNPPQYNGFKMIREMPFALSLEEGIGELRDRVKTRPPVRRAGGSSSKVDLEPGFLEHMEKTLGRFAMPRPAVVDTGNGASGPLMVKLKQLLNLNCEVMFPEPDGTFPNRGPDPMQLENIQPLAKRVRELGALMGAAVDGDGDRAMILDHNGDPVSGDFVAALLARSALKRCPGKPVLYDVRCSRAVRDTILECGGKPLVGRVGHVYMKKKLSEEGAAFAGELSGHYYFPEFFGADSGLLAALYLIRLASELGPDWEKELEKLRQNYHISGETNFRVPNAKACIARLQSRFSSANITQIDGVTFDFGSWWFNVRMSNTEPLLRLNLEASSEREMRTHLEEVSAIINA